MNRVFLLGRLTTDPNPGKNPSMSMATFTLAVNNRYGGDKENTDFIPVVCWNNQANFVNRYLKKGDLVLVEGSIRVNRSNNSDNTERRTFVNVSATNIQSINTRSSNTNRASTPTAHEVNLDKTPIDQLFPENDASINLETSEQKIDDQPSKLTSEDDQSLEWFAKINSDDK